MGFWSNMVSSQSRRGLISVITDEGNRGWLDPVYAPLHRLLHDMGHHLQADLHWVSIKDGHPTQMTDPSYLREVFQREILNFLVRNKEEPFMHQKRHKDNRKVREPVYTSSSFSVPQVNSKRSSQSSGLKRYHLDSEEGGQGEDQQSKKRRKD
jgi:hypothetical protein